MKIIDRIKSESSELGKWFTVKIPVILIILAGSSEALEAIKVIPEELIPIWLKQWLAIGVVISKLLGHLTVKKDNEQVS